jgi:hypothetical protein
MDPSGVTRNSRDLAPLVEDGSAVAAPRAELGSAEDLIVRAGVQPQARIASVVLRMDLPTLPIRSAITFRDCGSEKRQVNFRELG